MHSDMWKYLQENNGLKRIASCHLETAVIRTIVDIFKELLLYFSGKAEEFHENSRRKILFSAKTKHLEIL